MMAKRIKRWILVGVVPFVVLLAGCYDPSYNSLPTKQQFAYYSDLALARLEANPSTNLTQFEEEVLEPLFERRITVDYYIMIARYVVKRQALQPTPKFPSYISQIRERSSRFVVVRGVMLFDIMTLVFYNQITLNKASEMLDNLHYGYY